MARMESENIDSGTTAHNFSLLDTVSQTEESLADVRGEHGTVIMFICNHCPFVLHINSTIVKLANEYQQKGIAFVAISSNDATRYPTDAPEKMREVAKKEGYPFPYLYDETQEVAKEYGATCTPDIFLYNNDLQLFYHGQLDDSRPSNEISCDGVDLKIAMNHLLKNEDAPSHQKPSVGCAIKWKK